MSTNVYRWDPSGTLAVAISEDQLPDPNGICFFPDLNTLYVISGGSGPGDAGPGGIRVAYAFDVTEGRRANMRTDLAGNLWVSSNAPLGYAGVVVFDSAGKPIGRIRLPEACANLSFWGRRRNQLFMTASQSLYLLQVATQGAAPG